MNQVLAGKTVLVTRPKAQAEGLVEELAGLGATVYELPAIAIAPLEDTEMLDEAIEHMEDFDWIILTSVNGVAALDQRMKELGVSPEILKSKMLAAIGPATANAMEAAFRAPDLVPSEYVAEGIERELTDVEGLRFLLARADIARKDLGEYLHARGAFVEEVAVYRIVASDELAVLPDQVPDYITLTSSASAVSTKARLLAEGHGDWMGQSHIVCIGPITANTVRDLGYTVAASADEYTVPGLVKALVAHAGGVNA